MRLGALPPEPTPIHLLANELKIVRDRLTKLENNRGPTVPLYDPDNFPGRSVQGQIAIAHPDSAQPMTAHAYDTDNGWWQIGGGGSGIQYHGGTPTYGSLNVGDYIDIELNGGPGFSPSGNQLYIHQDVVGEISTNPILSLFSLTTDADGNFSPITVRVFCQNNTENTEQTSIALFASAQVTAGSSNFATAGIFQATAFSDDDSNGATALYASVVGPTDKIWGLLTDAPIGFIPNTGSEIKASFFLKDTGGGTFAIIAKVGATEVTVVSGTP